MKNLYLNRFLGDFIPIVPLLGVLFTAMGLSLSSASLVFFALAVSVMIFEIPAGVLADKISLKLSLVLSRLLKFSAFGIIFLMPTITGFVTGAIIWGCASAFDSGAFQSYLYCRVRLLGDIVNFERIYGRAMTASMIGLLGSAGLASLIAFFGLLGLQIIGLAALFLSVISSLFLPEVPKEVGIDTQNKQSFKTTLLLARSYLSSRPILSIIIIIGVSSGAIKGSLDEYTALLFLETGITAAYVGYFIFALEILKSSSALLASRITLNPSNQLWVLGVLGVLFLLTGIFLSPFIALICLALVIVLDAALWIHNDTYIQHSANDNNRATISSFKNFLTETLAAAVFLLVWGMGGIITISRLYIFMGGMLIILTILMITIFSKKLKLAAELPNLTQC